MNHGFWLRSHSRGLHDFIRVLRLRLQTLNPKLYQDLEGYGLRMIAGPMFGDSRAKGALNPKP